jgi:UDP-glucose 4-epimerase
MAERVLVTGGAGFVGSHVVDLFLQRGADVLVLDDLSTGREQNVAAGVELVRVDLADGTAVAGTFDRYLPTAVCHLGAQSSVTVSVTDPARDLAVNVAGTLHVCEGAARHRAPVVFASTGGALYGDAAPTPTPEDTVFEPLAPYGASKAAGEAYVGTWGRLHGVPNVVLRLGNVYGPRQRADGEAGVVSIFTDRLSRGDAPVVYGDGLQTRDYIHVADVASAFVAAATGGVAGTFNVGTGVESTVLAVLDAVRSALGSTMEPKYEPLRTGELKRSSLDSTRLRATLDWAPRVDFRSGIRDTVSALVAARGGA